MNAPPLIGISPNSRAARDTGAYRGKALEFADETLADAVRAAGGVPVMLLRAGATSAAAVAELALSAIARVDGLVLSGGEDVDPTTRGVPSDASDWPGDPRRDRFELALYRAAVARGLPVLAVCRGMQLVNVAEGGTLFEDLPTERPGGQTHRDDALYDRNLHAVDTVTGTRVDAVFGDGPRLVSSVHHQGLDTVAPRLTVTATSPDGLVEAVEHVDTAWVVGIQWHPEWRPDDPATRALFGALVHAATGSGT